MTEQEVRSRPVGRAAQMAPLGGLATLPDVRLCEVLVYELPGTPLTESCANPAIALVTVACKHEHTSTEPACAEDLDDYRQGWCYCDPCHYAGHDCSLAVLDVVMLGEQRD